MDWTAFWSTYDPYSSAGNFKFPGGTFADYIAYLEAAPIDPGQRSRIDKFRSWASGAFDLEGPTPDSKKVSWSGVTATYGELRAFMGVTGSTAQQSVSGQSSTGVTDTTAQGTSQSSTPSSGTIPTTPQRTGLAAELAAVMESSGFDPNGVYNGYEWAWFYNRTPSNSGYTLGPSELGISQDARIGINEAASRIAAYHGSSSTAAADTGAPTGVSGDGVSSSGSSRSGIAFQLEQVMTKAGYGVSSKYDGYQWAYFFAQTTAYQGQSMGPSELGLSETTQIGIDDAARRIEAYLTSGTPVQQIGGPDMDGGGGGNGSEAGTSNVLILGAMVLAGIILGRLILK